MLAKGDQLAQMLMMASMVMGGVDGLVTHLKPMLAGFGKELVSKFVSSFDAKSILDVRAVRDEIDELMTEKLEQLTAQRVKQVWCRAGGVLLWWERLPLVPLPTSCAGVAVVSHCHDVCVCALLSWQLMESVIREHLGWLIVWGNVFGALIGIISQAAGTCNATGLSGVKGRVVGVVWGFASPVAASCRAICEQASACEPRGTCGLF